MKRTNSAIYGSLLLFLTACQQSVEPDPAAEGKIEPEITDCVLTLGWDPWEPYHFIGANGDVRGLDIELVKAIAEGAGCSLEFLQGNWASLLRLVQVGELDLLVGATRTPEREEFAWFSDPYREEAFMLFVRAGEKKRYAGRDLEELLAEGFRLGVTQGYIYDPYITRLQSNPDLHGQFVEAAVGELNFTHLLDFRIDGFIEDPYVATAIERRRGWTERIEALELVFTSGPVHILFSHATVDESLVGLFNRSLEELHATGEYESILNRYLAEEF